VDETPLWKRGVRGDLKEKVLRYKKSLKEYGGIVILKISPIPSFPKRDLRVSTEKSEERFLQSKGVSLMKTEG